MSWYSDPQLFIYSFTYVYRITKQFGTNPIVLNDLKDGECLNFFKHLSLGDDKETDFDAFKSTFPQSGNLYKLINCQGAVINWDMVQRIGTWAHEEPNSPFWSLPGIARQEILVLKRKFSDFAAKIGSLEVESKRIKQEKEGVEAEKAVLKAQVNREREEKEAMSKRVLDLEAGNAVLEAKVSKERDEKAAMNARVLDLEAEIVILKAEVKKERDEKEAINSEVLDFEAEITILNAQLNRERDEKEIIDKRVLDLEAEINREKDVNNALAGALKREDMLSRLEALEEQVSYLTSRPVHR